MSQFMDPAIIPDRRHTNCVKWDAMADRYGRDDLLPLWVADMDFPSPPCIRQALADAAAHGIFGYFSPPASYQDAFMDWEKTHHFVSLKREWLRFSPGVITGMYWAISSLTQPQDAISILTPCYYPFMDAVKDTGRTLICTNLAQKEDASYTVDLAAVEEAFLRHHVRMFLLCSPHNPVSHVWREEELLGLLKLCKKHNVIVVSDEIHQDLTFGGACHCSVLRYPEYAENVILLTSGSKSFNIPALQNSFAVIPNQTWRTTFDRYVKSIRIKKGVSMGYIATEAGYRHGAAWLEETKEYIYGNYVALKEALAAKLPQAQLSPLEGTYMTWLDLAGLVKPENLVPLVRDEAKLAIDFGFWFWPEGAAPADDAHIRINLATSRERILEAAKRLDEAIRKFS